MDKPLEKVIIVITIVCIFSFGFFIRQGNVITALLPFLLALVTVSVVLIFRFPVTGVYMLLGYCFLIACLRLLLNKST